MARRSFVMMNVLVRHRRSEGTRRRRQGAGRSEAATRRYEAPAASRPDPAPPRGRRRELGPLQDQALYACACGYVFEATVSTSVDCPHCGDTQAW